MKNERYFSIIFPDGDKKHYTWSYQKIDDEVYEIHLLENNGFNERFKIYSLGDEIYVELRGNIVGRSTTLLTDKLYNIAESILNNKN